jgi:serine-type D-Ala-D-Ala carboxypeptidase (penicillin-binding protein 5/6)
VIDAGSGAILFEKDAHERLPPASLTKMATAIVALERGSLEQPIVGTVNTQAEPVVIGLEPGDRLPLNAALHGMLLSSGNDVALAIADSAADRSSASSAG